MNCGVFEVSQEALTQSAAIFGQCITLKVCPRSVEMQAI